MKCAILSLLIMTSTATTAAFAQEGTGQGPPHAPVILPTTLPTTTSPTAPSGNAHKLVVAPTH